MSATTVNALTDTLPSNIPVLSASGSNWAIWKLCFMAAVKGKDKWGHFDGTEVKPTLTGPTASVADDLHTWSKDEATAHNLLISKVCNSVALKIAHFSTVKDTWSAVVSKFMERSGYAEVDL